MKTKIYREIVEDEINRVAKQLNGDVDFEKQKTTENKSSFAFLYWFLNRYYPDVPISNLKQYITEGTDDGSCDIIFSNKDRLGNETFYVVQAKWFNQRNVTSTNKTGELVKASISDFCLILEDKKSKSMTNHKFNSKYDELIAHMNNNGNIKFIFLALCKRTKEADDNINSFNEDNGSLVKLDLYDINKLKTDFIELEYKEAKTHNPIETPYEPIGDIDLELSVENRISILEPDEAYIFLIKPKLIYDLFNKYQYSLFYRNIRNPLFNSSFNSDIGNTLLNNPKKFWYYNNGITAITDKIYTFGKKGKKVTVKGIQIINGAQTVYSIYEAYKNSTDQQKQYINDRVSISLRIITSSSVDEDMKITKYTNSQNPVTPRDFHANDKVQKRLQLDFFHNTNIWYETRRAEFRKRLPKKLEIKIIGNVLLGQTYLSYFLNKPILAKSSKTNLFLTEKESNKGLYDVIFNINTNYEDMLISYKLYELVEAKRKFYHNKIKEIEQKKEAENYTSEEASFMQYKFLQYTSFNILAVFRKVLLEVNSANVKGINGSLLTDIEKHNRIKVNMYYEFIKESIKGIVINKEKSGKFNLLAYFKSKEESVKEVEQELINKINATKKKELKL
jgi:AIPR protein